MMKYMMMSSHVIIYNKSFHLLHSSLLMLITLLSPNNSCYPARLDKVKQDCDLLLVLQGNTAVSISSLAQNIEADKYENPTELLDSHQLCILNMTQMEMAISVGRKLSNESAFFYCVSAPALLQGTPALVLENSQNADNS